MSELSHAASPPSLITCTISPLITNTLPHLPTLDHSQQHSPQSKTSSLSPCTSPSHPTSFLLQGRSLTIQLLDSTSKLQSCNLQHPLHFLPLHFTITASNQLHISLTPNTPSKIHHTPHLTYQFTPLQSQHPLYQPHHFHFHLDKHSRQSKTWWKW